MSSGGILSCILGYADPDVNAAVLRRVQLGSMATQQTYDEVRLAELLIEIHSWASMARFARTGGEAMALAVRIARASTGRGLRRVAAQPGPGQGPGPGGGRDPEPDAGGPTQDLRSGFGSLQPSAPNLPPLRTSAVGSG